MALPVLGKQGPCHIQRQSVPMNRSRHEVVEDVDRALFFSGAWAINCRKGSDPMSLFICALGALKRRTFPQVSRAAGRILRYDYRVLQQSMDMEPYMTVFGNCDPG